MASPSKAEPRRREDEMFLLMKAFESSGQTQRSFREAHGVGRSTFQYWLRRYRRSQQEQTAAQSGFVPLEVRPATAPVSSAGIVLTYRDGTRLEFHSRVEASFIRQLLGH